MEDQQIRAALDAHWVAVSFALIAVALVIEGAQAANPGSELPDSSKAWK